MKTNSLQTTRELSKNLSHLINKSLRNLPVEKYNERREIYNLILTDIKSTNCKRIYNELLYRIEDGENINTILLELIISNHKLSEKIYSVKSHLISFEYEDEFMRYFP